MSLGLDVPALLRQAQAQRPDHLTALLAHHARSIGAHEVTLLLLDYSQAQLMPPADSSLSPASVDGTTAGSCFVTQRVLTESEPSGLRVWVPVTERSQRLGVLAVHLASDTVDDDAMRSLQHLGDLAALLLSTASAYCDSYQGQRRSHSLELPAEMQWALLPPLSFCCPGLEVTGMLEPAYDIGGDCLDYSLDGDTLSVAMFDAMGHGLSSAVLAHLAIGAYRHGRRSGDDLLALRSRVDAVIAEQFEDTFVTALLAQLDVASGELVWHSAGHPYPLVLRDGMVLDGPPERFALPLGLRVDGSDPVAEASTMTLEAGDQVLMYTDGVVEGRNAEGFHFGLPQLTELFLKHAASGYPRNEVLRRLVAEVHAWQGGELRDDAALLLIKWWGTPGADVAG